MDPCPAPETLQERFLRIQDLILAIYKPLSVFGELHAVRYFKESNDAPYNQDFRNQQQ